MNNRESRKKKYDQNLKNLRDHIKRYSIHGIRIPEEKESRTEKVIKEILAEKFSNLAKDINLQTQEAWGIPKRINPKESRLRHMVKLLKTENKEKILKESERNDTFTYQGKTIPVTVGFSSESVEVTGSGNNVFQVLEEKPTRTSPSCKSILWN